jgi:His/Glu/Gln/Arg/opine family amino acid ABC transporter permease subunit
VKADLSTLLPPLLRAGVVTLQVSAGAWVVGSVLGLFFATVRHLGGRWVSWLVIAFIAVGRAIPQLVVLYLVYFGLPEIGINFSSIVAAILGLGVTESAFTSEYFRAGIATVADTQREAGESLGLGRIKIFGIIILPQVFVVTLPALVNSFVGLLKLATLASAVGAPEVLYRGQLQMNQTGNVTTVAAVVIGLYVIVTLPGIRLVRRLERVVLR